MIATAQFLSSSTVSTAQPARGLGIAAVICTRDRPELLRRALHSLLTQIAPPAEIIVIDNAPRDDAARRIVEEFADVRYVREETPGLDYARNRALRVATQQIVAFLDDDAVADPSWSQMLLAGFHDDPRLGACTGRVEPLSIAHEGQRIVEQNGGYSRGSLSVLLPRDANQRIGNLPVPLITWAISIGSGCSMAVRRDAALAVGGFDELLERPQLPGGGDHDMLWRLLTAGCNVRYEPAAVAWHEHRREAGAAYSQIVGHQRGFLAFLIKATMHGTPAQRAGVLAFMSWRLVKPGMRVLKRMAGRDPLPVSVLLRMWLNCWRGLISYPLARIARNRFAR